MYPTLPKYPSLSSFASNPPFLGFRPSPYVSDPLGRPTITGPLPSTNAPRTPSTLSGYRPSPPTSGSRPRKARS
eukprot:1647341-Rhodomonas_salina.4